MEKVIVTLFEVQTCHLSRGPDENKEESQSG